MERCQIGFKSNLYNSLQKNLKLGGHIYQICKKRCKKVVIIYFFDQYQFGSNHTNLNNITPKIAKEQVLPLLPDVSKINTGCPNKHGN